MQKELDTNHLGLSIIISPHDDDGIIGCGGIIYALNPKPVIIVMTDGCLGYTNSDMATDIVNIRKKETILAYTSLGIPEEQIIFLEYPDMSLRNYQNWVTTTGSIGGYQRVFSLLRKYQPKTVFLPYNKDKHPDHQITFDIGIHAITRACKKRMLDFGPPIPLQAIYMYQVWEHILQTTQTFRYKLNYSTSQIKKSSINAFKSQANTIFELEQKQTLTYEYETYELLNIN